MTESARDHKQSVQAVVFDLDGVIWREYRAVPFAAEVVEALRAAHIPVAFLSNTSARRPAFLARRLQDISISALPADVFTSGRVTAQYLVNTFGSKANVLFTVTGSYGALLDELRHHELNAVDLRDASVLAHRGSIVYVAGYCSEFSAHDIELLLRYAKHISSFYASERDRWYASADGIKPGAGWVIAASEEVLGRKAVVLGKPSPYGLEVAASFLSTDVRRVLMVGDSVDSDIEAARAAGAISCLYSGEGVGQTHVSELRPDYFVSDLRDILTIVFSKR